MKRRVLALLVLIFSVYLGSSLFLPQSASDGRTYLYSARVTYVNRGPQPQSVDLDFSSFNMFMNTSWQTAYMVTANGPHTLTTDIDGNAMMVFDSPQILPGKNVTVSYAMRIDEKLRAAPDISMAAAGNLSDVPKTIRDSYTGDEGSWVISEQLKSLAYNISSQEKTSNVLKLALGLADWIGRNVADASHDFPYYPNQTYASREGDCDDQANLLIAFCRVLGIPAYLQVGALKGPSTATSSYWGNHVASSLGGLSYHGWAMVYVPPWGWLPFDMTLGWRSGDELSVVRSARAWGLDELSVLNVTVSDWAGEGQAEKREVLAGSLYLYYEESLTDVAQVGLLQVVSDWRFQIVIVVVASVAVVAVYLMRIVPRRRPGS